MKYKTFTAALMGLALLSGTANATCYCPSTFLTDSCSGENQFNLSKLNPLYYTCYAFMYSVQTACSKLLCSSTTASDAKLQSNQDACSQKDNESGCEAELDKDVTAALSAIQAMGLGADLGDVGTQLNSIAKSEAESCAAGKCN